MTDERMNLVKPESSNVHFGKKYNKYDLSGEYGVGYCSNTNTEFYFDLEDYDKIKDYCWIEYDRKGYHSIEAWNLGIGGNITMNWLITGKNCDHKNRNPLDNRKFNLRPCTTRENAQNKSKSKNNTSGIIGVHWDKRIQKWVARIKTAEKRILLGNFSNKEDAIVARLKAEQKYFNEFAPQRHLFEQYKIIEEELSNDERRKNCSISAIS